jgi:hypothetical protein
MSRHGTLMRVSAILPSGLGTNSISVCSGISSRGMSCTAESSAKFCDSWQGHVEATMLILC